MNTKPFAFSLVLIFCVLLLSGLVMAQRYAHPMIDSGYESSDVIVYDAIGYYGDDGDDRVFLQGPLQHRLLVGEDFDYSTLPLFNVFVPWEHKNVGIKKLSFEELDAVTMDSQGRSWNDMERLCQSIEFLYGEVASGCVDDYYPGQYQYNVHFRHRSVQSATASFEILPRPAPVIKVVQVDPLYPPWAPTYSN